MNFNPQPSYSQNYTSSTNERCHSRSGHRDNMEQPEPWGGSEQNRYGLPHQNPDEHKKGRRLDALLAHDSMRMWMPLVI